MANLTKGRIDLTTASAAEAKAPVGLWNAHLGTQKSPEQWLWQYAVYEPSKAVFTTLEQDGGLLGTQGMMPFYLKAGTDMVLTAKSENSLIRPEFRGGPAMQDLYAYTVELCRQNGFSFIWTFSTAVKAFSRWGFTILPGQREFIKKGGCRARASFILSSDMPAWRKAASAAKLVVDCLRGSAGSRDLDAAPHEKDYALARQEMTAPVLADFYAELSQRHPDLICLHFDEKFISWRIHGHPFLKYQHFQVIKNQRLLAYAMVAFHENIVRISDLTSLDDRATDILLRAIIREYFPQAIRFTVLVNPANLLAQKTIEVLAKYGFAAGQADYFVLRDLGSGGNDGLADASIWHTNGLWTEGFYY